MVSNASTYSATAVHLGALFVPTICKPHLSVAAPDSQHSVVGRCVSFTLTYAAEGPIWALANGGALILLAKM